MLGDVGGALLGFVLELVADLVVPDRWSRRIAFHNRRRLVRLTTATAQLDCNLAEADAGWLAQALVGPGDAVACAD